MERYTANWRRGLRPLLFALPLALALLSACSTSGAGPTATPAASHGGTVTDQPSLIDALRAAGFTVNITGNVSQPFLSGSGTSLEINGDGAQVYEYPDATAAQADAAKIQPDGTVPGASISWVAQPHFYQTGNLIVIYTGTNAQILAALELALGKPFATGT